jgi:hypothetical protein
MAEFNISDNLQLPPAKDFSPTTDYNHVKFWKLYTFDEQKFIAKRLGIEFGSEEVKQVSYLPKAIKNTYHDQQITAPVPSVYLLRKRYTVDKSFEEIVSNLGLKFDKLEKMAIQQYHLAGFSDYPHLLPSKEDIHSNLWKITTFGNDWETPPNFLNLYENENLVQAFPLITSLSNPRKLNISIIWKYCNEYPELCRYILNPPSIKAICEDYEIEDLNYILQKEGVDTKYTDKKVACLVLMQVAGKTTKKPITRQEKRKREEIASNFHFPVPYFQSNKILRTSIASVWEMELAMTRYLDIKFNQACTIEIPNKDGLGDNRTLQLYMDEKSNLNVPPEYWTHANKCHLHRFVIMPCTLNYYGNFHANVLLYDRNDGVVEWFEPWGISDYYDDTSFELNMMFKKNLRGFKLLKAPTDIHEGKGLQCLATQNNAVNECHTGFCGYWVIWYLDLRLSYPDMSRETILKNLKHVAKIYTGVYHEIIKNYYLFMQSFSHLIENGENDAKLTEFIKEHMQLVNAYRIIPETFFISKLNSKNIESYLNQQLGLTPELVNFMECKGEKADLVVLYSLKNGNFHQFDRYGTFTGYSAYKLLFKHIRTYNNRKESLLVPLINYAKDHAENHGLIVAITDFSGYLKAHSQSETDEVILWFRTLDHSPARYLLMKNYPLMRDQVQMSQTEFSALISPVVITNDNAFTILLPDASVITGGDASTGGKSDELDLTNVCQVHRTKRAFAALRYDGTVVSWGDRKFGGDSSSFQDQLKEVYKIRASDKSFAVAIKYEKWHQIKCWNEDALIIVDTDNDPYKQLYSNSKSFMYVTGNKWAQRIGGKLIQLIQNVIQVIQSASGFAVRNEDNQVFILESNRDNEVVPYDLMGTLFGIGSTTISDMFVVVVQYKQHYELIPYLTKKGKSFTIDFDIDTLKVIVDTSVHSDNFLVLLKDSSVILFKYMSLLNSSSNKANTINIERTVAICTTSLGFAAKHENNTIAVIDAKGNVTYPLGHREVKYIQHNSKFNVAILIDGSVTVWWEGTRHIQDLKFNHPVSDVQFTLTSIVITLANGGGVYTWGNDGAPTAVWSG